MTRPQRSLPPLRAVGLALLATLAACAPVDPSNPHDPAYAGEAVTLGRVTGRFVAPPDAPANPFRQGQAQLWQGMSPDTPLIEVPVQRDGTFNFDAVRPGMYRLELASDNFTREAFMVPVMPGETSDLGDLAVVAVTPG